MIFLLVSGKKILVVKMPKKQENGSIYVGNKEKE